MEVWDWVGQGRVGLQFQKKNFGSVQISYDATMGGKISIQWNSVNKSTSGQPVLDLIRGGFNNRIFYNAI